MIVNVFFLHFCINIYEKVLGQMKYLIIHVLTAREINRISDVQFVKICSGYHLSICKFSYKIGNHVNMVYLSIICDKVETIILFFLTLHKTIKVYYLL